MPLHKFKQHQSGRRQIILLYDFLAVPGGAEKLSMTLLDAFPDMPLCCAFRDPSAFGDDMLPKAGFIDLHAYSDIPAWRILKIMAAFTTRTRFLQNYDRVLFSGVFAPLAVRNHPIGPNLLYCHTIPRFAYDLKEYYLSRLPLVLRPAFHILTFLMRHTYSQSLAHMDIMIANSRNIQQRLKTWLNQPSIVIHPPVDTDRFCWIGQQDYYVSLARLEHFKRVDRIVEAFVRMPDKKLVVTSSGSDLKRLQQMAKNSPNIVFTGWQTEEELRRCIGNAVAAIYIPVDEDFGMSPVEAMAAGKPVIGVAEGGLLETVVPNETGILLEPPPTIDAIQSAVRKLTPGWARDMRSACEVRAKLFDRKIFLSRMLELLDMTRIDFPKK